jgi:hypothetical protein
VIEAGSLEYAHARLGARFGARPDELAWRRIEMIRDLGGVLDAARASPLAYYLGEIGPDADSHAIESALRTRLRERVHAIADWEPPQWRKAIEWCALLPDLPLLQHLARGGVPPPWLRDDALGAALRDGIAAHAGPAFLLAEGKRDPDRIAAAWRAEWQRRLPVPIAASPFLAEVAGLLTEHATAFRDPLQVEGWTLRRTLHARLTQLFRRAMLTPASAFIFLALSALDCERLRGELLRRVVFPRLPLAS